MSLAASCLVSLLRGGRPFMHRRSTLILLMLCSSVVAWATVLATVRGLVHDAQHRPIPGAQITLHANDSDFALHTVADQRGEFSLPQAPIGIYRLEVQAPGFDSVVETITLNSGTSPLLHIPMTIASHAETVVVQALGPDSPATD